MPTMTFIGAAINLVLAILAIVDSRVYHERRISPSGGAIAWSVIIMVICAPYMIWGTWGVNTSLLHVAWISIAPAFWIIHAASAIAMFITAALLIVAAIARLAGRQVIPPGLRLALGITMLVLAAVPIISIFL